MDQRALTDVTVVGETLASQPTIDAASEPAVQSTAPISNALSALSSCVRSGEEMSPTLQAMVDEARRALYQISLERLSANAAKLKTLETISFGKPSVTEIEIDAAACAMFLIATSGANAREAWDAMLKSPTQSTTVATYREFAREALIAAAKVRAR